MCSSHRVHRTPRLLRSMAWHIASEAARVPIKWLCVIAFRMKTVRVTVLVYLYVGAFRFIYMLGAVLLRQHTQHTLYRFALLSPSLTSLTPSLDNISSHVCHLFRLCIALCPGCTAVHVTPYPSITMIRSGGTRIAPFSSHTESALFLCA